MSQSQRAPGSVWSAPMSRVPGASAWAWARGLRVLSVITVASLLGAGVSALALPAIAAPPVPAIAVFIVVGISAGLIVNLARIGGGVPNEKAEVSAGYTTLPGLYPNLDHRHPRTGEILRPAGGTPLSPAELKARLSIGSSPAPLPKLEDAPALNVSSVELHNELSRPASPFPRRRVPTKLALVFNALVILVIMSTLSVRVGWASSVWEALPWASLVTGAIVGISVLLSRAAARRRLSVEPQITAARPGVRVFPVLRTPDLVHAGERLNGVPSAFPRYLLAAADSDGIALHDPAEVSPLLFLGWDEVAEFATTHHTSGMYSYAVIDVVVSRDGEQTRVPLALVSRTSFLPASVDAANSLFVEVGQLRDRAR